MEDRKDKLTISRFAKFEDILTPDFIKVNEEMTLINKEHINIDHDEINRERFDWFKKLKLNNSYYASRYWEYPFAILNSQLSKGMKCADIGCGTTPFTPYLCEVAGKRNVTGIDNNLIDDDTKTHYSFGVKKSLIKKYGFNFVKSEIDNILIEDNYFDVVYCISVLEHIDNPIKKQKGLLEMVRILKPGGKLVLTFDTGINTPLNDPLKIISFTGLTPYGNVNLEWPINRFVQYEDMSMDVFGLVLYKDDQKIFVDQRKEDKIYGFQANEEYLKSAVDFNIEYSDLLKVRDLKHKLGWLKLGVKQLLKRY